MNRTILGAVSALLLAGAGLFWWQGQASIDANAPPPPVATGFEDDEPTGLPLEELPDEDGAGIRGAAPPDAADPSKEAKRFNRVDRNRDNMVSRTEMLQPRVAAFRKLDTDHNNLLSFEEWSVATNNRFKGADGNGDGALTRGEFAATRPKPSKKPACRC
ncbi:MAG: hypothetical protein ABL914_10415 [Novosphingobium sp.]|uniref:hypothetical protein n=1 Tax=Novosphingobium sp. TaxID=1874826 RepID=UPI0032BC42C1